MNCKRIQEIIITDYIDGQIEDKQKGLIDQHLSHCPICEGFLINVKKEAINPFINVQKEAPDVCLWAQIKQAIEEEQAQKVEQSLMPNWWERWESAIHIPRPAVALTTLATVIFIFGSADQLFMNNQLMPVNGQDQAQYLSSLIDEPVDAGNGNDLKTPIEQYFL